MNTTYLGSTVAVEELLVPTFLGDFVLNLQSYVNEFTPEDFEPGPHGRSVLKGAPGAYFERLARFGDEGVDVEWNAVAAGRAPNGIAFFVGQLTLTIREREGASAGAVLQRVSVPGSAEGENPQMGISGVATTALGNALLRGLGMAAWLYENDEPVQTTGFVAPPPAPPPQPSYPPAGTVVQPPQQGGRRPFPGNRTPGGGQSAPQRDFGPWDGTKVSPKSGTYANVPYANIPVEVLQKWASGANPNQLAIKELNARMSAGGGVAQDNTFGNTGYSY